MSGEQIAMWRKLLLVVLLLGIGYLIWRRMQNAGGSAPVTDLSAKPPMPVPSTPPPSPASSPPAPSTPSATGSAPRPVVTRIHRGAPPSTRRSTAPPSGDAASARRNGVDSPSGKPAPETAAHAASVTTPGLSETAGSASSLPETTHDQGTSPAETASAEVSVSVATIPEPDQLVVHGEVADSTTTTTTTTSDQAASEAEAVADPMLSDFTPIDINRADREALMALPGIGPVLAERIITYREAHGPFKSVDDLTAIAGIGERNINIFRKLVRVDPND
jgi:competence protein ComEA